MKGRTVPVKFELSLMKVRSSLRTTIPKEICEYLKLNKGDKILMWVDDGHIIIEKKKRD